MVHDKLAMDDDVKEVLDQHTERIRELELTSVKTEQRLCNIEEGQNRLENTVLQSNNAILQTLNQIVVAQTVANTAISKDKTDAKVTIETNKNDNKSKVFMQLIITSGATIGVIIGLIKVLFG